MFSFSKKPKPSTRRRNNSMLIYAPQKSAHQTVCFLTLCARVAYTKKFGISRRST
jgi:hypothetical protein